MVPNYQINLFSPHAIPLPVPGLGKPRAPPTAPAVPTPSKVTRNPTPKAGTEPPISPTPPPSSSPGTALSPLAEPQAPELPAEGIPSTVPSPSPPRSPTPPEGLFPESALCSDPEPQTDATPASSSIPNKPDTVEELNPAQPAPTLPSGHDSGALPDTWTGPGPASDVPLHSAPGAHAQGSERSSTPNNSLDAAPLDGVAYPRQGEDLTEHQVHCCVGMARGFRKVDCSAVYGRFRHCCAHSHSPRVPPVSDCSRIHGVRLNSWLVPYVRSIPARHPVPITFRCLQQTTAFLATVELTTCWRFHRRLCLSGPGT